MLSNFIFRIPIMKWNSFLHIGESSYSKLKGFSKNKLQVNSTCQMHNPSVFCALHYRKTDYSKLDRFRQKINCKSNLVFI